MMISRSVVLFLFFILAACGGGSGSGSTIASSTSSTANSTAISSAISSVIENSSLASSESSSESVSAGSSLSSFSNMMATHPLNDTGITGCIDQLDEPAYDECSGIDSMPGQDGEHGRDAATITKVGSGSAGFDFTKLDAAGQPLSADATEWSCVRDNHTGLVWEVKTKTGDLRDEAHTYSWYNPDAATNGNDAGVEDNGQCVGSACDTNAYIDAVNVTGLCGAQDWRLPNVDELLSIVHNGRNVAPLIDTDYFPLGRSPKVWTSAPYLRSVTKWVGAGGKGEWVINPDTQKEEWRWEWDCKMAAAPENEVTAAFTVSFEDGSVYPDDKSGYSYCSNIGSIFLVRRNEQ